MLMEFHGDRVGADVNFVVLTGILVALGQPKLPGSAKLFRKTRRPGVSENVAIPLAAAACPESSRVAQ